MNQNRSLLSSIPPVVKNLIIINLIMWLATLALPNLLQRWGIEIDLTDVLGMHYWASEKFNVAQLFTYMFMHSPDYFGHVLFNMFALYMFGSVLEYAWGSKRFLIYYLITGVGAGIVQQLFWTYEYQPLISAMNEAIANNSGEVLLPFSEMLSRNLRFSDLANFDASSLVLLKEMYLNAPVTVGASGSVFGLLLAFGWLFPQEKIFLMFIPIPIPARIFVIIYGVAELFLGVARFTGDSIAHFAHLGGMLFGIILILLWSKKRFR